MIPITYPSQINSLTGRREMVISPLASNSGLVPWNDYIPIKFVSSYDSIEGTTDNEGFISVTEIDSTNLNPFVEYIPVYVDDTATDAWSTSSTGYIPVEHSGYTSLRNILNFTGSGYGTLATPITFGASEDFEIDIEISSTYTTSGDMAVAGNSADVGATNYIQIDRLADSKARINTPDGAVDWLHTNTHRDGKAHILTVYRSGTVVGIKLDGVIKAFSDLLVASEVSFDHVGCLTVASVPNQFFKGQAFSIKFTNVTTGAVKNYVLDSSSTLYQLERGTALGGELVTFGDMSDISSYTGQDADLTISGGKLLVTNSVGGAGFGNSQKIINTTIGKKYVVSVDFYKGNITGYVNIKRNDTDSTIATGADLTVDVVGSELVFTAASTETKIQFINKSSVDGNYNAWDNLSTKQLPDSALIYTNVSASDIKPYTLQRNYTYLTVTYPLAWVDSSDASNFIEVV